MIRITMQNGKTIDIELDHSAAPITCENFEKLVKDGFYNGLTFHRTPPAASSSSCTRMPRIWTAATPPLAML